jgi:hypothetical protein
MRINSTNGRVKVIDDLQYVVSMLKDTNLHAVSKRVGLNYRTVWTIAKGTNTSPAFKTVKKLADYFRAKADGEVVK